MQRTLHSCGVLCNRIYLTVSLVRSTFVIMDSPKGEMGMKSERVRAVAAMMGVLLLSGTASAQAPTVIEVTYTTTAQDATGEIQYEAGTYYFGRDGYRHDRTVNGERTSLLVRGGQRVEMNHDLNVAVRGPADGNFSVPMMEPTGSRVVTGGRASAMRERQMRRNPQPEVARYNKESLGTRALGPLLLQGFRHTFEPSSENGFSRVAEHWIYVRPDGLPEGLEESETVYTASGDVFWSRVKSVVSARRVARDPEMFDVPGRFQVREYTR